MGTLSAVRLSAHPRWPDPRLPADREVIDLTASTAGAAGVADVLTPLDAEAGGSWLGAEATAIAVDIKKPSVHGKTTTAAAAAAAAVAVAVSAVAADAPTTDSLASATNVKTEEAAAADEAASSKDSSTPSAVTVPAPPLPESPPWRREWAHRKRKVCRERREEEGARWPAQLWNWREAEVKRDWALLPPFTVLCLPESHVVHL